MSNFSLKIDWMFVVAIGLAVGEIIRSAKMTPEAAEKVSTQTVDAYKEFMSQK